MDGPIGGGLAQDPAGLPTGWADDLGGADDGPAADGLVQVPVLAAVVASGVATGLEATLEGLAAQDYGALSVVVLDAGCTDDPTARVATVTPGAFVLHLEGDPNPAAAANSLIGTVEGVSYLLFCRAGVVLEPDAVRHLAEEAYRTNAAIIGPKVVDLDHPEILLEVGMGIDHYGEPFSGIEPGEIDQEQHDALQDVFYVSSSVMLVRGDLFAELGGFDPATYPGAFDLDFCWRARLAGGRVLVIPDARARDDRATHEEEVTHAHRTSARDVFRSRLRVLVKCYAPVTLLWVLPVALLLNILESFVYLVSHDRRRAGYVLSAWPATIRALGPTLEARRAVQKIRRVDDREIRGLMIRGSARLRTFLHDRLHAGDRIQELSLSAHRAGEDARDRFSQTPVIAAVVLGLVLLFGIRSVVLNGAPEVGSFVRWPGTGSLLDAFWSSWRWSELGRRVPAPAAFGLLSAWSAIFLGHTGLARSALIVLALPVGGYGSYRLTRRLSASPLPAVAAAIAYVANPLGRNLVAVGDLGPLITFALAPFLFIVLLRGMAPATTARRWMRPAVAGALLTAVIAAFWPPGGLLAITFAIALVVAVPLAGGLADMARVARAAMLASVGALVLLVPWTFALLRGDANSFGLLARRPYDIAHLARFQVGPHGGGLATWGLFVTALVGLLAARGDRWCWAVRGWSLVVVSYLVAYVPSRLSVTAPVPSFGGVLIPAAIGISIAIAAAVGVVTEDLRVSGFGWRQPIALAALLGLALPMLALAGDSIEGDWHLPNHDWHDSLAWMGEMNRGQFRVLWLGTPEVLPGDARQTGGVAWGLSKHGTPDARDLWVVPASGATRVVDQAVSLLADDRTPRFGRLVGPMGVRYVALVDHSAPGSGRHRANEPRLVDALGKQVDLAVVRTEPGLVLYENQAWTPSLAAVPAKAPPVPAGARIDPTSAALTSDPFAFAVAGDRHHTAPIGPGTLLWAESHDDGWKATSNGKRLDHLQSWGWANGFRLPTRAPVSVVYDAPPWRPLLLLLELALWVGAGVYLFLTRRPRDEPVRDDEPAAVEVTA